jgi:dolichyl-diphosphooligosaccharide--protein glycosyltransferase
MIQKPSVVVNYPTPLRAATLDPLGAVRRLVRRPTASRRAIMVFLVLSIVFTIAVLIRSYSSKYGYYLNEFDPYYDYYAAQHIVNLAQQHGLFYAFFNDNTATCTAKVLDPVCHSQTGYFYWHDVTTWFPYGRDVAASSQGGLQTAGALIFLLVHNVFGVPITLYSLLVLLPVFFGALTAVLFYFLVRRIAGDAAGLFSALIIAVSPPLIERGNLGWFKSEPLAILLFVAASYLLLTVFDKERGLRSKMIRAALAGVFSGYSSAAWGGGDYFSAAFGLLFFLLPFMSIDIPSVSPSIVLFTALDIIMGATFPRPGVGIVTNPAGLALIGGTLFLLAAQWARTWTKPVEYRQTLFKLLFAFAVAGLVALSFGLVGGLSLRYLSAINPLARTTNALVQSVAEHAVPTGQDYFTSYALLLSFGMAGVLVAFRRRNVPTVYALVIGLTALYFSAAFSRLLVYSSVALALLGGIGFAELAFSVVKPSTPSLIKKKPAYTARNEMKVVFSVAVIALLVIPAGTFWIPNPIQCTSTGQLFCDGSNPADAAVSLANGATSYSRFTFNDWTQALQWIRQSTPTNSVFISWWDYGYWITVMGNRTSAADNSTINSTRIALIGRMLMSNATQAANIAKEIATGPDGEQRPVYVLEFITGSIVPDSSGTQHYILQIPSAGWFTAGGGDESKKQWFIRIGGLNESQYLACITASAVCQASDDFNLTPYALQNSLFSQLLPFRPDGYLVASTSSSQSGVSISFTTTYQDGSVGSTPVAPFQSFAYPYKPLFGTNSTGPFRLVYPTPQSPVSLNTPLTCPGNSNLQCFDTIVIYQVV